MKKYKRLNLIIKPTNACNLSCEYCFESGDNNFCHDKKTKLTMERFDKIIKIFSEAAEQLTILYHGGEPTLIGKKFFIDANEIIKKYMLLNNCKITCSIQTNNTLIDKEFLEIFKLCQIKIGTSYDGITNEITRKNTVRYNKCFDLEKEEGFNPGAICVVSNVNINDLIENYKHFNSRKQNLSLNPILLTGAASSHEEKFAISAQKYAEKLKELFDYWLFDKNSQITISPFTSYLSLIYSGINLVCCYGGCVGRWFNMEPNGDIYPCNRCFPTRYCYGNIDLINSLDDLLNSKGMENILKDSTERIKKCKEDCEVFMYCKGGCNNSALIYGGMTNNNTFWCKINRELFNHVKNVIDNLDDLDNINKYVKNLLINSKQNKKFY